jgi:excisionase family DNA binding protein
MSISAPDPLRSIHQAADRWGVKPVTVRKKVARRDVTVVRIGRRVLIPESEIVRIIEQGTVPALGIGCR